MTKEERKAWQRAYYLSHREERLAKMREHHKEHKANDPHYVERRKASTKAWRKANPDKVSAQLKRTRLNHLDERRAKDRAYGHDQYLDPAYKWEDVEGYDGFTKNTHVHHRLEALGFSVADLKARGWYYNRKPDELICLTISVHRWVHGQINKTLNAHD